MKFFVVLATLLTLHLSSFAQTGIIEGRINDETGAPLPFANVLMDQTQQGVACDEHGDFIFSQLKPGTYTLIISYVGYESKMIPEVRVTNNNPSVQIISLTKNAGELQQAVVNASPFDKKDGTYNSIKTLSITEIERAPGANRDLSKVLQSLPGVAQGIRCRNDLIIRGGGPSENRFYLDDIETPNINHFATQGATGGPNGMIDVNYINDVELFTGTVPAEYPNALGAVLKVKFKEPRADRIGIRAELGADDYGLAVEGPLAKNASFFISARKSWLQFLFAGLKLPFLPIYNDVQGKIKWKLNEHNEIYTLFLGAYDINKLNLNSDTTVEEQYILAFLPEEHQWNYTNGYVWKYHTGNYVSTAVISRNQLDNTFLKYKDNLEQAANKILDYHSRETENKFRWENTFYLHPFTFHAGLNYEHDYYMNSTFHQYTTLEAPHIDSFSTTLPINKFGGFVELNKSLLHDKMDLTAGVRTDASDYSSRTNNPLKQLSPRFMIGYHFTPSLSASIGAGSAYQLPPYTVLGYRDSTKVLANRSSGLQYINSRDIAANISILTSFRSMFSVDGFYKRYSNYPFLLNDSIPLSNVGDYWEIIGNEKADSRAKGKSYGFELLYHQKMAKGFFGIASYTYLKSDFTDRDGNYVPSSWDSRHNIALTMGKLFKRNWQLGARWRYSSGNPYTPLDTVKSSLIANYSIDPTGVPDMSKFNAKLLPAWNNLDMRVDKTWYFKSWSLNIYFDLQNATNFASTLPPIVVAKRDDLGNPIVDPNRPDAYLTYTHPYTTGTRLESLGIIFEY